MLFNSYEFIFAFLPLTFFIYFYLNKKRLTKASKAFLVFSSLFFYSWWNIIYLPLIVGSMLFNYIVGKVLIKDNEQKWVNRKIFLTIGITANITLLSYFKYTDFFITNLNVVASSNVPLLNLVLPLAISFFTFQQIAYLVDSYLRKIHEHNLINYAIFISFFPQLIAGPIVHHKEMIPQFSTTKNKIIQYRNIAIGLFIFAIGLFKKVVIADTFAFWANNGFQNPAVLTTLEAWATTLAYTFQIYFDFSGYTDMAIGAALLFNIKLPINFHSPYKATNIQTFWKHWHITLSQFLKDYLYIPLGGNRQGEWRTFSNMIGIFIVGGLWHGPSWTFVFWGLLHGIALIVYKLWKQYGFKMNIILAWLLTFNFINLSWIFFRAESFDDALILIILMTSLHNLEMINPIWIFSLFLGLFIILFFKNSTEQIKTIKINTLLALLTGLLYTISLLVMEIRETSEFLYFQF